MKNQTEIHLQKLADKYPNEGIFQAALDARKKEPGLEKIYFPEIMARFPQESSVMAQFVGQSTNEFDADAKYTILFKKGVLANDTPNAASAQRKVDLSIFSYLLNSDGKIDPADLIKNHPAKLARLVKESPKAFELLQDAYLNEAKAKLQGTLGQFAEDDNE